MTGAFTAGRVRAWLSAAVGVLLAGAAMAQPGAVAPSPPSQWGTWPGGPALRQAQAQEPPPVVPQSTPLAAPKNELVPTVPPLPQADPSATLIQPPLGEALPPLPGSTEDQYLRELDARRGLQTGTWWGATATALPSTLLWEPPLAVKKDPRMQFLASDQANYRGNSTIDTSIGMTIGLYRLDFEGADFSTQVDIFGLVITRLTPDDLIFADYRFGLPVTWRWGWWQGKVGYEHTSAHIGDELIRAGRVNSVPSFAKDELVLGLGRYVTENLRVYGQFGYAFGFQVPGFTRATSREKSRYDLGAEWFLRCPTGWQGTPFAAVNVEWRGDQGFTPNYTFQAGWLWRNPYARLAQFRVFAEHYRGNSPFGHAMAGPREQFTAFGFGFDY